MLTITTLVSAELPVPQGKRILEPMDYHGVTLMEGSLKAQVDEVRRYYLAIPNDDLLKGFRQRAGLPAPGKDLGGWYTSDTFHVFGQIVSGLARLYAGTGDTACREKANLLVNEWAKCIASDGYFYAAPKPNAPHYIYDKMLWGLLDDYLYCGNREALSHISHITDWAIKNLERSRKVNDTSTEWYTLSENLYRAYLATGDPKYRDFAEVWEYRDYWDTYARKGDIFAARPDGQRNGNYHAYSHVNTLGGAGAAYLVKGEARYLDTLKNAYEFLQKHECFASGGFGPDEQLLPQEQMFPNQPLVARLKTTHHSFETQCGSWAAFKLSKYLISFTGDARYGDWVERLIINGIGAGIPMTADGRVYYYADYCLNGGSKHNIDFGWSCCTGTRPQAIADYHDLIYFRASDGLCVNLFIPSSVKWDQKGTAVTATQSTAFPRSPDVQMQFSMDQPTTFVLKLRWPAWLTGPINASVNGQPYRLKFEGQHWVSVQREWRNGDQLNLQLPMNLRVCPLDPPLAFPTAVMFGPTLLAFKSATVKPLRQFDPTAIYRSLVTVTGNPLHFCLSAEPSVLAQPFYEFQEDERYFVYLDPHMRDQIPHSAIKFQGLWHNSGQFRFSNEIGATAECSFEGTSIRWLGFKYDDAGRAEVSIDGQVVAVVDQYGPGRDLPFNWSHKGLSPGRHTLRIKLLPEAAKPSKDHYLNVAGFEVISD